jgi:hypothetical protein
VSLILLADARKRVPSLPADDTAAQNIINEQEAWLARRLGGPLTGERTETFWVAGTARYIPEMKAGRLSLSRFTDEVAVVDNGVAVVSTSIRLIDRGSAVILGAEVVDRWWTGPYVEVTYEPNDKTEVKRVLYQLIAWEADPPTVLQGERIGSYSYTQATSLTGIKPQYARAALIGDIAPRRDPLTSLIAMPRYVSAEDAYVINGPGA